MAPDGPRYRPPEPLSSDHDFGGFDCGEGALNAWLKTRALRNQTQGASRTYVLCTGDQVVGYYSLAVGSIQHEAAIGKVRRNMPDPVPAMLLGRPAIDRSHQGHRLAKGLLKDAVLRTLQAADIAGIRVLFVHAISEEATRFYTRYGFRPSPTHPMTLMITLAEARLSLGIT